MAEYIERKALLDELCRDNCERGFDGTCHNCRMTETISDFPAADVEPVVHGKWLEVEEMCGDIRWKCSACGIEWCFIEGTPKENGTHYCPNCGAKMDLD